MTDGERQTAFDALLAEGESLVWTLCLRVCGRADLARDAFQDAWIAVWRALPGFRGEARPTTWIWRIAVRACGDVLRRERRGPQTAFGELPDTAGDWDSPADALEKQDLLDWLLEALTPRQRALIHLRYTQELSYEEIAETLEIGLSAVKVGLHRAKAAMRGRWERAQAKEASHV